MSKGLFFSAILHGLVVVTAWIGIPFIKRAPLEVENTIVVELVVIAEVTAAPPPKPESEPEPEPLPQPQPQPEPEAPPEPETPPPPLEQENQQVASLPPAPKVTVPPRKPPLPKKDSFQDLVSLVKNLEQEVSNRPKPEQNSEEDAAPDDRLRTLQTADRATLSERDTIKIHIERCWRIDPGKEGIRDLSVDLRVGINPDGSVRQAIIEDTGRYFSDPNFRAFADGARTAVLSCSNIPISPQRYEIFKEIVFTFSPQGRIN